MVAERLFQPVFHQPRYPTLQQCQALAHALQTQVGSSLQIAPLASRVPDRALQDQFYGDLAAKNTFLALCSSKDTTPRELTYFYKAVHDKEVPIVRRLGAFGITI
jgi:hypothetical protein